MALTNIDNYSQRTLYEFRTRLSGGGARSNLFECDITIPQIGNLQGDRPGTGDIDDITDLKFLIKAAQLPGSTIGSIPVPFRGRTLKIAGDRTYDPWTITVINDTRFNLRNLFERWSNILNRHDDSTGVITPSKYQSDIVIHQLSRGIEESMNSPNTTATIKVLKSYKLFGCFPTSVDPIPVSYDSTDTIEEFNVTFEVQYMDAWLGNSDTTIFDASTEAATTTTQ